MRLSRFDWDGENPSIAALVRGLLDEGADAGAAAGEIISEVRAGGDAALMALSERFDGGRPQQLVYGREELVDARHRADAAVVAALQLAASNLGALAAATLREEETVVEPGQGQRITVREVAVASAGIYAPGGRAAYPSSVIMGVVPAKVAGVERIVVATPPGDGGRVPDAVLAAASLAGADRVYAIGGAQAIAALAYGTESVESVDLIAGPGGPIVQAAKLAVSRSVGIDGYAGPSELMVLFDDTADLEWLALDLCAQAEHGADGLLIAAAADPSLLQSLGDLVERTCRQSGLHDAPLALVALPSTADGVALADRIAPEHLEIACRDDGALARQVRYAGCVFTGKGGATAFGDYVAGSNHVLPTGGAGRFRGPLGPSSFRRPISLVDLDRRAAGELADALEALAGYEGFALHARSARIRAEPDG